MRLRPPLHRRDIGYRLAPLLCGMKGHRWEPRTFTAAWGEIERCARCLRWRNPETGKPQDEVPQ